ncbi:MAG: hypothetical protein N3A38_10110 [Planctomycetota bacterium]|nr:hypothetical protein [Planctomycetota bacterium]
MRSSDHVQVFRETLDRMRLEGFAGYDPFDALGSRLFRLTPLYRSARCRQAWIQLHKLCPVNLRPLLFVPRTRNAKTLALVASACLRAYPVLADDRLLNEARALLALLDAAAVPCGAGRAWGYPFDWQSRSFFVRAGTPNIVVTSFAGAACMDAWERTGDALALRTARAAARAILTAFHRGRYPEGDCFPYTPGDGLRVHNANLLAAAFLARMSAVPPLEEAMEGEASLPDEARAAALAAIRFSVAGQASDGSWPYGLDHNQRWIDGFHTAYNLMALEDCRLALRDESLVRPIRRGLDFYLERLIGPSGEPFYFADRPLPYDIHSAASAIVALCRLAKSDGRCEAAARKVFDWTMRRMYSGGGRFAYRRGRFLVNGVEYMRWGQAWMLYALAHVLEFFGSAMR